MKTTPENEEITSKQQERLNKLKEMGYKIKRVRKIKYTAEQIKYLKHINSLPYKKEMELYARGKVLYESYQKRLIKNGGDLYDYELEVFVTFSTGTHETRYIITELIFSETFKDADFGFGHPEEKTHWDDSTLPYLGTKLCWFTWKFFDDIPIKLRFKITQIWFEIHIQEQNCEDIVKYKYI